MTKAKRVGYVFAAIFGFLVLSWIYYYLPSTVKVMVTDTEVKRHQNKGPEKQPGTVRDIRYIMTQDIETGEARVFRNEDTGWGWPPYFKFNSGDLAGTAANIAKNDPQAVVLVKYYGMRSTILSLYPNIIAMEIVQRDYTPVPWFNIVFFVILIASIIFAVVYFRRLKRRLSDWWQGKKSAA